MQAEAARNCFAFFELFLQILCMLPLTFELNKKINNKQLTKQIKKKISYSVEHDAKVLLWKALLAALGIRVQHFDVIKLASD